jgi:hypothetical protein
MKYILFCSIFFLPLIFTGQNKKIQFSTKAEYIYQKSNYLTLGIGKIRRIEKELNDSATKFINSHGPSLNFDFRLQKEFNFASTISYEYSTKFLILKLKSGVITNFKNEDYFITPQAGFSIVGAIYILYGYNFSLNKRFDIDGHMLTIGWNMDWQFSRDNN